MFSKSEQDWVRGQISGKEKDVYFVYAFMKIHSMGSPERHQKSE